MLLFWVYLVKYTVKITSRFFKVAIRKLKSHVWLPVCVQESLMMEKNWDSVNMHQQHSYLPAAARESRQPHAGHIEQSDLSVVMGEGDDFLANAYIDPAKRQEGSI